MGMYGEVAAECRARQKERNYIDNIAVSVRLNYIDGNGKTRYIDKHFSGGQYRNRYLKLMIEEIERDTGLPLRMYQEED